jgi:SAM-dependent methyltransferase
MPELPPLDTEHPNSARMYDYWLGGFHNFEADRRAARAAEAAFPGLARVAQANRAFLRRAVRYLAEQGIDQFLDLGSGVPTVGNVHEIAHQVNPDAKVVYVDNEAVAVHASRILLADEPNAAIVPANLLHPDTVLDHPATRRLLDFERPLAIMLVSVLHFEADDDLVEDVVRRYVEALRPGSYLTISHFTDPAALPTAAQEADGVEAALGVYRQSTSPLTWRTLERIEGMFAGLELVEPGVAHVLDWRPDGDRALEPYRARMAIHAAVGRKP